MNEVTEEQLEQWRKLAAEATPGPWQWGPEADLWDNCGPDLETVTRGPIYADGSQGAEHTIIGAWGHDAWGIYVEPADAAFIAAAREAMPALVAEVRRLRTIIAEVDSIERWPYNPGTMQGFELDQAQGYNDALAEIRRALHPEAQR